jgi:hypothetical protein
MSDIQRLKAQLYQLMTEAQQGAGSLGGFRQKFGQTSAQVQALIAGSATGADRDISQFTSGSAGSPIAVTGKAGGFAPRRAGPVGAGSPASIHPHVVSEIR